MVRKPFFGILIFIILISSLGCYIRAYEPPSSPAPGRPNPPARIIHADIGLFYDDLAPYGDWFWLEGYGWVWSPYGASAGWRPYTNGYWIYTDYGLTWVSYYDWGWAPFHYGRWLYDPYYGWVWVPGTEWAPAWVAWRHGNGWIGWAPLPPQARWRVGIGIDLGGLNIDIIIKPFWWCFTEENRLFYAGGKLHIVPESRNVTVVKITKHVTNYVVVEKKIVNKSIDVKEIERAIRRPVTHYSVVDVDSIKASRVGVREKEAGFFRPELKEASPGREPKVREEAPVTKIAAGDEVAIGRPGAAPQMENEKKVLERQHEMNRTELERIQQKEMRKPPTKVSAEELRKQHEEERKALEEKIQREKDLLKKKQEREQKEKEKSNKARGREKAEKE